jgi:nitrate reductase NapE component
MSKRFSLMALVCWPVLAVGVAGSLAACGGGGGDPGDPAPTEAARLAAAQTTALSTANDCAPVRPFYWEIGDGQGLRASGSTDGSTYTASTVMAIASASKWLYAAYVAQVKNGTLNAVNDVPYLNFSSGYTGFDFCLASQTVAECQSHSGPLINNGGYSSTEAGRFAYSGGHMQKHAVDIGLGAMGNAALATEIRAKLGTDINLGYSQPQLAGGVVTSAADYAVFLRKLIRNELQLRPLLATQALCASDAACARTGVIYPAPTTETWHYSLGHWVEDDPVVGDGAVSSAGAFGFYPWINRARDTYGILARKAEAGNGFESVRCGRLIRKAWETGIAR